jgi:hypothetical protein
VLAELAAAMLDALEAHFVLYEDGDDAASVRPVPPTATDQRGHSVGS